jgi:hypothetical protein
MVYVGNGTFGHGPIAQSTVVGPAERAVSIPGLIAAAAWVAGLVGGLIALATGHEAVAAVALGLAIMSPWLGLAWVSRHESRGHRRATDNGAALLSSDWPVLIAR